MTTARDLMQSSTLTIPASMPFREVQHLMVVAGVHSAPVVNNDERVVGMVSAADLLRAADQAYDEDLDEGEEPDDAGDVVLERMTAQDLASPDVVWVAGDTPANEVAKLMRRESIHRVLVGNDGRLEGIVTTFDLLALLVTE